MRGNAILALAAAALAAFTWSSGCSSTARVSTAGVGGAAPSSASSTAAGSSNATTGSGGAVAGSGGATAASSGSPAGSGGAAAGSSTAAGSGGSAGGATSTGASSSSSSSGASSSGASSSSSGGGVEVDCTNGIDDDGDGLVDCADPDCTGAGYQCAADAPAGWSGPALLYTGAGAAPACGSAWTTQPVTGGLDVGAQPAACGACACGAPSGSSCFQTQAIVASDAACATGQTVMLPIGVCIALQGPLPYLEVIGATAGAGSCAPSGGAAMVSPAAFGTQAAVCAAPAMVGGGCAAGVCAPQVPAGYGAQACVFAAGDLACPGAPYVNKTLVYTSIDDQRGCSACTCGAPAGGTCPTSVEVFYGMSPGCSLGFNTIQADGACHQVSTPPFLVPTGFFAVAGQAMGGTCAPGGGQPSGQAAGAQPTTVCCD